ncbi:unnamed protein product [Allacma fusca]|uniref:Uncharacterized protein n=1 Tax=Allacma fusca TaxID=39272 RepID=A0A8J2NSX8_9HEXA|nr:unnamed protein product [Allacma fusca]
MSLRPDQPLSIESLKGLRDRKSPLYKNSPTVDVASRYRETCLYFEDLWRRTGLKPLKYFLSSGRAPLESSELDFDNMGMA